MNSPMVEKIVRVLNEHEIKFSTFSTSAEEARYYCACTEVQSAYQQEALRHQAVKILDALGWKPFLDTKGKPSWLEKRDGHDL